MRKTKRVKLTWPWTSKNGTKHKQNDVIELDFNEASMLVRNGRANEVPVRRTPRSEAKPNADEKEGK